MPRLGKVWLAEIVTSTKASDMGGRLEEDSDGGLAGSEISERRHPGWADEAEDGRGTLSDRGLDDGFGSGDQEALLPAMERLRDLRNSTWSALPSGK